MNFEMNPTENHRLRHLGPHVLRVSWWCILFAMIYVFDGRTGHWLIGLTSLVAVRSTVLPHRYFLGRILASPIAGLALWLGGVSILESLLPPRCSPGIAERDAAPLIAQLDTYRRQHGHYPPSLEAAGLKSPHYRCGDFQYQQHPNGQYTFSIGDYRLDQFTASWSSAYRDWTIES